MEYYSNFATTDSSNIKLIKKNKKIEKINKNPNDTRVNIEEPEFIYLDETLGPDPSLMQFQKNQTKILWTIDEIEEDHKDIKEFESLDKNIKQVVKGITLFFTNADKVVIANLDSIVKQIPYKAAAHFYKSQEYVESVHDISYEKTNKLYYNNPEECKKDVNLLNAIIDASSSYPDEIFDLDNYSCEHYEKKSKQEQAVFKAITTKINSMKKWMNINSFHYKLLGLSTTETIGFNALFAIINSLKEHNKGLKFLIEVNEFVARDEAIHALFGMNLYKHYVKNKIPNQELKQIIYEITEIEIKFLKVLIPNDIKINNLTVLDYINYLKYLANMIYKYYVPNGNIYQNVTKIPGSFNISGLKNKANFFERTASYVTDNKVFTSDEILKLYPKTITLKDKNLNKENISLFGNEEFNKYLIL